MQLSSLCSILFFFNCFGSSSDKTSSSSGNETDFLTMRGISADSWGMTNMLLITTTMRMIYWIHSHTSNSWPASSLRFVFVMLASGLANWLVRSSTSSTNSYHSSAIAWNWSSATTWESDSGLSSIITVTNDNSWCSTGSCERSSVSCLSFTIWNNSSFRKKVHRQDISHGESSFGTSIDKLTSVHTFYCNEILSSMLVSVRISEHNSGKWCSTTWIVNNFFDNSLGISFSFLVIQGSELSRSYSLRCMRSENGATSLSLHY